MGLEITEGFEISHTECNGIVEVYRFNRRLLRKCSECGFITQRKSTMLNHVERMHPKEKTWKFIDETKNVTFIIEPLLFFFFSENKIKI